MARRQQPRVGRGAPQANNCEQDEEWQEDDDCEQDEELEEVK